MNTKELLKRYNQAFADVMAEEKPWRLRLSQAIRAMTLAEIMRDNERMLNAAEVVDHLFANRPTP